MGEWLVDVDTVIGSTHRMAVEFCAEHHIPISHAVSRPLAIQRLLGTWRPTVAVVIHSDDLSDEWGRIFTEMRSRQAVEVVSQDLDPYGGDDDG